jgi:nucleoside-diphosphate-sugar epimerase
VTCVAITGATGFIGRALVTELLRRGDTVLALVRPTSATHLLLGDQRVALVEYRDLADPHIAQALRDHGAEAFVHLAWGGVVASERDEPLRQAANVDAALASVRLAAAAGCAHWLGTGSQAEHGPSPDVLDEGSPTEPITRYGRAKVAACTAALAAGEELAIATCWARVFSVYGPGDRDGAVLTWAISRMLDGEEVRLGPCTQAWDLLYVDDAAAALLALVDARATGVVNVASGVARPLRDAVLLAATEVGPDARASFDATTAPTPPLLANTGRLRSITGWEPAVDLGEGVRRTVAYLRESRGTAPRGART